MWQPPSREEVREWAPEVRCSRASKAEVKWENPRPRQLPQPQEEWSRSTGAQEPGESEMRGVWEAAGKILVCEAGS